MNEQKTTSNKDFSLPLQKWVKLQSWLVSKATTAVAQGLEYRMTCFINQVLTDTKSKEKDRIMKFLNWNT